MKNLFYLSVLVLTAGLAACASDEVNEGRNYQYAGQTGSCGAAVAPAPRPAPMPVASNCGCKAPAPSCGCQAQEYTVRTPVKVVYQNTTYRTVYEPKTFQSTSYETRPYNRAEVCSGPNCGQPALMNAPRPM
ncbi:MAG: hypothetical protein IJ770_02300 [Alphaproteobacteria bacterium]|nr:hypothetical protein [Alphaproteobacteria bacterium]